MEGAKPVGGNPVLKPVVTVVSVVGDDCDTQLIFLSRCRSNNWVVRPSDIIARLQCGCRP